MQTENIDITFFISIKQSSLNRTHSINLDFEIDWEKFKIKLLLCKELTATDVEFNCVVVVSFCAGSCVVVLGSCLEAGCCCGSWDP